MAQIDPKCPAIIEVCAVRVTLLNADGTAATGDDTSYVSSKIVSVEKTPDVEEGERRTQRSGCGCLLATTRQPNLTLGYTFSLVDGVWEVAMLALMLGVDPIYDTSDIPVIIGLNHTQDNFSCDAAETEVAFEIWEKARDGSGPDPDLPWKHSLWPRTKWSVAASTASADFNSPTLSGFSEGNSNWDDPYGDLPMDGTATIVSNFLTEWLEAGPLPDASCALQTIPA